MIQSHNDYNNESWFFDAHKQCAEIFEYDIMSNCKGEIYVAHNYKLPFFRNYKGINKILKLSTIPDCKYIYIEIKTGNEKSFDNIFRFIKALSLNCTIILGGDDYTLISKIFQKRRELRNELYNCLKYNVDIMTIEEAKQFLITETIDAWEK